MSEAPRSAGSNRTDSNENDCAGRNVAGVDGWTYWIRRDGRLLEPTTDIALVRPGDRVEVELDVTGGCEPLQAELLSFRGSPGRPGSLVRLVERDVGTFEAGAHILWVDAPERPFSLALAVKRAGEYRVLDQTGAEPSLVNIVH